MLYEFNKVPAMQGNAGFPGMRGRPERLRETFPHQLQTAHSEAKALRRFDDQFGARFRRGDKCERAFEGMQIQLDPERAPN